MGASGLTNLRIGLHVGLPKTGTSSLQQLCFARHSQAVYFGQSNVWTCADARTVLKAIITPEGVAPPVCCAREVVDDALRRKHALVISDEAMSLGAFMLRARKWPCISDHKLVAENAKRILGSAHVFIVLRNQVEWLESWHRQGVKTGKYVEEDFERWLEHEMGDSAGRLFELLDYESLYKAYAGTFGADFVHVRLYEAYREDLSALAGEFSQVIGIDPVEAMGLMDGKPKNVTGPHYSDYPVFLKILGKQKHVNSIVQILPKGLARSFKRLVRVKKPYQNMGTARRVAIRCHFESSNRTLMSKLGIHADGLGYF